MADWSNNIPVITLNVNDISTPIKKRLEEWIKTITQLHADYKKLLHIQWHRLKAKGWKNIHMQKINNNRNVTISISNRFQRKEK